VDIGGNERSLIAVLRGDVACEEEEDDGKGREWIVG
jgi:hypothetical protein